MKFAKKALLFFFISFAFGVLWLVFGNLVDISRVKNFELIIFTGLFIASICLALLFTRKYIKRADESILKKVGYIVAITIPSFSVMVGGLYTAIIIGLTYLH